MDLVGISLSSLLRQGHIKVLRNTVRNNLLVQGFIVRFFYLSRYGNRALCNDDFFSAHSMSRCHDVRLGL